jgi:hypothetical protein
MAGQVRAMSHFSNRIILNDAGTVKTSIGSWLPTFSLLRVKDGRAKLTRQRAIPLNRVTCHAK